jgi:hypothetical protein
MTTATFLGTVDTRTLPRARGWEIMSLLFPRFVEEVELGRYVRGLLSSRQWRSVRLTPHLDADGVPVSHVFDVEAFVDE